MVEAALEPRFSALLFKRHWCSCTWGTSLLYSIMRRGKAPFLFFHMFMMRYVPKQITSATVMVFLMQCDSYFTERTAVKHIADVHPCDMPHYKEPEYLTWLPFSVYLSPSRDVWRFMCLNICVSVVFSTA